ncbi:MAG: 5-formyltetrahydrofolate cyclo-ligase [Thermoanaerobacterales bacterium]|nr:5-formyltetrahydrofolate cyclo-ligase [Thermoanaerobacterales bacterium]
MTGTKDELRRDFLERRGAMSSTEVAVASAAIGRRVLALEDFLRAGTVMAYVDVRSEVRTGGLIRAALRRGQRVALPVPDPRTGHMVAALAAAYPAGLVPGPYGIPVPSPGSEAVSPPDLDCVLVPGVAFDEDGFRLGYGGGYYDRFLSGIRGRALAVGLAYAWQVVPRLAREPHDRPVDLVVTEEWVLRRDAGR